MFLAENKNRRFAQDPLVQILPMPTFQCFSLDITVHKNSESHIDASLSRQPLVKGERLVRYEVNAVIHRMHAKLKTSKTKTKNFQAKFKFSFLKFDKLWHLQV